MFVLQIRIHASNGSHHKGSLCQLRPDIRTTEKCGECKLGVWKSHGHGQDIARTNRLGSRVRYVFYFPSGTKLMLRAGGGIDCLISSRLVGTSGKVYGLDMTEAMISLARKNAEEAGVTNVEYLLGTMESIPLADGSVDVIISNCVINLAADKDIVLQEAYRVLKEGGNLAISDIVLKNPLPEVVRQSMEMWTGCVSGALLEAEYTEKLREAGFSETSIEEVKVYTESDVMTPYDLSDSLTIDQGNVECGRRLLSTENGRRINK